MDKFTTFASRVMRQLALVEAQQASEMDGRMRAEEAAAAAEHALAEETARRERAEQQAALAEGTGPHLKH